MIYTVLCGLFLLLARLQPISRWGGFCLLKWGGGGGTLKITIPTKKNSLSKDISDSVEDEFCLAQSLWEMEGPLSSAKEGLVFEVESMHSQLSSLLLDFSENKQ